VLIIIIFILAFVARYHNLGFFPLNCDESGILASPNNFIKFYGIPVTCSHIALCPFIGYFVFFAKKFFYLPVYIVRIPSLLVGTATIPLIYNLAKRMYGQRTGLIASVLLCFLPWHVVQSRIGIEVILVPFFGCLIGLALFKCWQQRSSIWFMLFWFFLGLGSFYTYQASILFVCIFPLSLLFLRKQLSWIKPGVVLSGLLIFFVSLHPLLLVQFFSETNVLENMGNSYIKSPFDGNFFINVVNNFKNNILYAFQNLLFSERRILYGAALNFPLLIHWLVPFMLLFSIIVAVWRRSPADKVSLIWLGVGFLGPLSCINLFQPRYIIIALPIFLILVARLINDIVFNNISAKGFLWRKLLSLSGIVLCVGLVSMEIFQLRDYYIVAPTDLEECRQNNYGCRKAAFYLSQVPDVEDYQIIVDTRMTVLTHFEYTRGNALQPHGSRSIKPEQKGIYYLIWAPESHPDDYWGGSFRVLYNSFKYRYKDSIPVKTIYYPDGSEAIYIFKIDKKSKRHRNEAFNPESKTLKGVI